ncbi:acetamidase/formamidase family protein [Thalassobacillus devorans]|uniref:acetamidase/formamidase family protein n=1 Tax=Thalassobacillus devorans TaxID=279813 RepID=UPI0020CB26C3|nr:acetamidase/formamidase family protein [Thalassobacillus devorans]
MTRQLTCQSAVYALSKENPPAITIQPGETLTMETYDCFQNQIQSETTEISAIDWNQINPATGPVYVEGAEPGDILKVKIDQLKIGERGVMVTGKDLGVLGHRFDDFDVKIIPIKDNQAIFDEKLSLPLNPMIGVIGVAPENESVNCGTPGAHGGNMDTKVITEDAELYFPVFVEGALFALGDFHAAMGDGEVSVSGIEVPGEATVTFELIKKQSLSFPLVANDEGISLIVSKETLDDAVATAVEQMVDLLHPHTDLTLSHLTMLMSAAGEVQVSQVVDPLVTARFFVPKHILETYDIQLF